MSINTSAKEDPKSEGVIKTESDSLYSNNARAGALLVNSRRA